MILELNEDVVAIFFCCSINNSIERFAILTVFSFLSITYDSIRVSAKFIKNREIEVGNKIETEIIPINSFEEIFLKSKKKLD